MSKQSPSERQAELERAAKYNACPDCKRPTARTGAYGACIIRGSDQCIRVERDNLRVEMASLRERNQLEVAVVEALIAERSARDAIPSQSLQFGEFPSQEFWNANHHLEGVHVETEKALDALLAHRQRNNDGNG